MKIKALDVSPGRAQLPFPLSWQVPFAMNFFPIEWEPFPLPRAVGCSMYFLSTFIVQVVLTWSSGFEAVRARVASETRRGVPASSRNGPPRCRGDAAAPPQNAHPSDAAATTPGTPRIAHSAISQARGQMMVENIPFM